MAFTPWHLVDPLLGFVAFAVVYAIGRWLVLPGLDRVLDAQGVTDRGRRASRRLARWALVGVALYTGIVVSGLASLFVPVLVAYVLVAVGYLYRDRLVEVVLRDEAYRG